jgi:phosphoadenosine phosphosulfate reductase
MVEKGSPPTRLVRWCCQEYKENFGNFENKVIGVRAEESNRRKATWKEITKHRKTNSMIFAPILYWTEKDIWDFHKIYNLNYCELYDQGYKRLGCIGCPMAGKARKKDFERYPRYKKMWQRAFKKMWETNPNTKKGKPRFFMAFGSPENFFKWWMEEKEAETNDCQMTDMFT